MVSLPTRPPTPWAHLPHWGSLAAGVVLLAAVVVVVAILARLRVATVRGRQDWELLSRLGPELVGQSDEAAILRIALADAPRMFHCERVFVRLHPAIHRPALVASVQGAADDPVDVAVVAPEADVFEEAGQRFPLQGPDDEIGSLILDGCARGGRSNRERLAVAFAHMLSSSLGAAHALGEERRLVEETEERAAKDDLTALGNRWLLDQWGDRLLTVARSQGKTAAMLLFDVDDFKRINDTLGHEGGDRVLAEIGRRIQRGVRVSDLAVRFGGDEFAVLTGDLNAAVDAEMLASRLLEQLARPVVVDDVELAVQASIGIAISGEDGDDVESLLRSSDEAMYAAKSVGPGQWRRATRDVEHRPRSDREQIADDLKTGLLEQQLVLHYQPQVDARTGHVCGFEALARWQHPELGLLTPAEFVPVAERTGLMRQLTAAVLDHALRDWVALDEVVPGARLAVNVSARNLLSQGLVEKVSHFLDAHAAPPTVLKLEISEPSVGTDSSVAEVFAQLEVLGARISVSEYGTGQSSLTALAHLPGIGEIKISPGLVARMHEDPAGLRLVHAITTAAHSLGVEVVAEGVETLAQVQELRESGCDVLQGYYVNPPATLEEILAWVGSWPAHRATRLGLDDGRPLGRS